MKRILITLALAMTASVVFGQTSQTGMIRGTVTDSNGEPLPGVAVRVAQADGSFEKSAFTGDQGQFRIGFLKPGRYDVQASMAGFAASKSEGLKVSATEVINIALSLQPSSVGESMVVTASEPLIDRSSTEFSTTLTTDDTEMLPISRTATELIEFTPGARSDQVWGGSTEQTNNYQLDGVTVNSPGFGGSFLLPNVNWIKEFQVKGLGAGAEYGNFQGGLINIVTKSGSNTFEGDIYLIHENESLNSSNFDDADTGSELDAFTELNASIGGAFVKDKLYYFFSIQQQQRDVNVVDEQASSAGTTVFLPIQEERTETKLFGKLTYQATSNDTFNLVFGADDVETDNRGLSSFTRPEATTTQDSPATFYNLSWERVFGTSQLEVKFTGYDAENNREPQNGDIAGVRVLGGDRALGRNADFTRLQDLSNNGLSITWDSFFQTGKLAHHLKVGGDWTQGEWLEQRIRNGGMTWRPERGDGPFNFNDPSTWGFISSDWGGNIRLDAETTNTSVYVQDYITVSDRLDLSVGLRWGSWEGKTTPGDFSGPQFTAVDADGIAPRIGLTYDLLGDGQWIGKAHWGRYYQNIFALMFDRAAGTNAFQNEEYWDWIGDDLPDLNRNYTREDLETLFEFFDDTAIGEEQGPVQDYDQPFVDQLVIGLEKQIGKDMKVGVTYINRENKDIVALVDRNQATNYTAFNNVGVIDFASGDPVLDQSGNPLVLDRVLISNDDIINRGWAPGMSDEEIAALTFNQDLVLSNVDEAFRDLNQIQITFEKHAKTWDLYLSATHSDLEGNFYSASGYDNPSGTGSGAFVNPNERINFAGNLQNISEWEGKVRFSAKLPWGLRFGSFFRYDSGDYYSPSYTIDSRNHDFLAADGEFFSPRHFSDVNGEAIFLETRGNREFEARTRLDIHLEKNFFLSRGVRLQIGIDVFNLFNEDAVDSINTEVGQQDLSDPSTLFQAVRGRQTPRSIRFQTSLRW